ncbi:MAG: hypothetical protein ISS92_06420 [Candidatus Omnitrophica bacterium]|nr:hypothetical protein [Candidatus Omnitrophota bacterium]
MKKSCRVILIGILISLMIMCGLKASFAQQNLKSFSQKFRAYKKDTDKTQKQTSSDNEVYQTTEEESEKEYTSSSDAKKPVRRLHVPFPSVQEESEKKKAVSLDINKVIRLLSTPSPSVQSLDPDILVKGKAYTLTIKGRNFGKEMSLDLGRGIQTGPFKLRSSKTATMRIFVTEKAKTGKRNVYLLFDKKEYRVANITVVETSQDTAKIQEFTPEQHEAFRRGIREFLFGDGPLQIPGTEERADLEPIRTPVNIVVTFPRGGEVWAPGDSTQIVWEYHGFEESPEFEIDLVTGSGDLFLHAADIPATDVRTTTEVGDYYVTWEIPPDTPFGRYRVRVTSGGAGDTNDEPFFIGYFAITNPASAVTWYVTHRELITWQQPVTSTEDRYQLSIISSDGRYDYTLSEGQGGSGRISYVVGAERGSDGYWTAPSSGSVMPQGEYRLTLTRYDGIRWEVPIRIRHPYVSLRYIPDFTHYYTDDEIDLYWTCQNLTEGQQIRTSIAASGTSISPDETRPVASMAASVGHFNWVPNSNALIRESRADNFTCFMKLELVGWEEIFSFRSNDFVVRNSPRE